MLDTLDNPNTPRALNYRGYATRKLGRTDEGIGYYLKSVALDPAYPQVREYLGEAYVIQGKYDLAKDQLATIEKLCGSKDVRILRGSCRSPGKGARALDFAPRRARTQMSDARVTTDNARPAAGRAFDWDLRVPDPLGGPLVLVARAMLAYIFIVDGGAIGDTPASPTICRPMAWMRGSCPSSS